MGGPTFNFRGDLEILGRPVGEDLRKTVFEASNLDAVLARRKDWAEHLSRTRGGATYSSVELTIVTKASDEGAYDGQLHARHL